MKFIELAFCLVFGSNLVDSKQAAVNDDEIPEEAKPEMSDEKWIEYVMKKQRNLYKLQLELFTKSSEIDLKLKDHAADKVFRKLENALLQSDEKTVKEDKAEEKNGRRRKRTAATFDDDKAIAKIVKDHEELNLIYEARYKNEARILQKQKASE